jgi:hypothetical protein
MTRVSELQKGQEIVVVPSNDYFPSASNSSNVFAEEGGKLGLFVPDGKI